MNTLTKLTAATVAITMGTVAMADPNIDRSEVRLNNGTMGIQMESFAAAGAQVQGTSLGTITIDGSASNRVWAGNSGDMDFFVETDNAGAGVSGEGTFGSNYLTYSGVEGTATQTVSVSEGMDMDSLDINTQAGTFGSVRLTTDFNYEVDGWSDDWN